VKDRTSRTANGSSGVSHADERESMMFLILFVVLLVAWLLGWFTLHAAGGLIHVLLVVAVIFLIVHFVRGRA
jgi:Family of unknown function (DUF5670)